MKTWTATASKKIYNWQVNIWKISTSSRKYKLKHQWNTATHLLEWPQSRTLTALNADENMEQQEVIFISGWNTKWYSHSGRQFLTKLDILLPYDWAIMLTGVYPKEFKTCPHKHLCMDVYSSFIYNCQTWKPPRRRWMDK